MKRLLSWEHLKEKNTDDEMLKRYRLFGMKHNPKGYKVRVLKQMSNVEEILEYSAR